MTSLIVVTRPGTASWVSSIAVLARHPVPITMRVDAAAGARSGTAKTAAAPKGRNSTMFAVNSSTG
jgi:hypothetical protein